MTGKDYINKMKDKLLFKLMESFEKRENGEFDFNWWKKHGSVILDTKTGECRSKKTGEIL